MSSPLETMEKHADTLFAPVEEVNMPGLTSFRHWMISFVVCNFNVDIGPEVEFVYPPTEFTTADLSAICFNSFPERQDGEADGDLTFQFAISNNSPDVKLNSPHIPYGSSQDFYGSVIFRQEFDATSKRSFNQKSLVLISNHNFPSFFSSLLKHISSSGLISDPTALEAAFTEISSWSPPSVGRNEMPFMGSVTILEIPPHAAFPLQGLHGSSAPRASLTQIPTIFAYEPTGHWNALMPFMPSLNDIFVVYETVLLCETLIVVSKSPQICSHFISSAIDLIKPIPYNGIVKPYVTMQSDFQSIGMDGGHPRPFIIGITNPFLLRRLIESAEALGRGKPTVLYLDNTSVSHTTNPLQRSHSQHHRTQPSFDIPGNAELYSLRRSHFKADRSFTHSLDAFLSRASETSEDEITTFVRRHFSELTAQFLSPINRYLATGVSPAVTSPGGSFQYANFSQVHFLQSLSKHGTAVKFRGQGLMQRHKARGSVYGKFCQSLNWHSWLQMKIGLEKEASAGLLRSAAEGGAA